MAFCNFQENIGLKDLNISWNGFTDDGAVAMAEALTVNGTLVNLDMSSNRIKGAGFLALCTSLKQNTALRRLLVGANMLNQYHHDIAVFRYQLKPITCSQHRAV